MTGIAARSPRSLSGTLANLPANGATPNGSLYFATDSGQLYEQVAGVQIPVSPATTSGLGLIAGPVYLSSTFDVKAVATTMTDVTGMSIAVPASSKTVVVRFKCEMVGNGATATSGSALSLWLVIADSGNNNKALVSASVVSTGASVVQNRDMVIELVLEPPVSAATYKLRAQTSAAIPANWGSLSLLPSGGLVSGAKDALTAIAY